MSYNSSQKPKGFALKIFIIHLERATQRRASMLEAIENLKEKASEEGDSFKDEFIFFKAIDAKNNEHLAFKDHYKSILAKIHLGTDLTQGELACYASHFSLWQECVRLNEPIIILEDDMEFLDGFMEGVERIKNSPYEYVRLRATDKPKKPFIPLEEHFALAYGRVAGAQGYYLTPLGARKFIDGSRYWVLAVDIYMDKTYMHGVKNILHIPYLIQESLIAQTTTITDRDEYGIKKSLFWRIMRELYRPILQLREFLYRYFKL